MAKITVIGLGPADERFFTDETRQLLESPYPIYLRTRRHPSAQRVEAIRTFDDIYQKSDRIEDVYTTIVETLCDAAEEQAIVYAVPGSPLVAETTVELLRKRAAEGDIHLDVRPAMSFLDLAWCALDVDPFVAQPRLLNAHTFTVDAAGERGPLLVTQCDSRFVLSEMKLAFEDKSPNGVVALQRLGLPNQQVIPIDWQDIDRVIEPDPLTSLYIAEIDRPIAKSLQNMHELATRLRRDCPWDAEQTHESLCKYAIEETYELVDAIVERSKDGTNQKDVTNQDVDLNDAHLIEELGDVMFQVFAHAAIAEEEGRFTITDVADELVAKLVERHPHVYSDVIAKSAKDVEANWEASKQQEKQRTSLLDGIPRQLPALAFATKVLSRAARVGVEYVPPRANSLAEVGLGETLLAQADFARRHDLDAEDELRRAVLRFFDHVEKAQHTDVSSQNRTQ